MACFCCSIQTFTTFWTAVTIATYPMLLYFIYRDYSISTVGVGSHLASICSTVIGVVLLGFLIRSWFLGLYEAWRGLLIEIFGTLFFVALYEFEFNGTMMGVTFLTLTLSVVIVCCSDPPGNYMVPGTTQVNGYTIYV